MRREPHKRPAGEVIAALQEPETSPVPSTSTSRRPIGIILGIIFILLRATSGVLWMLEAAGTWDELDHELFPETTGGFYTLIGFYGSWTIALLVLAWLLWQGSDAVRLTVLLWTTVTIIFIAVDYYAHGERITIHTTLVTLALDILVLLALSGQDARTWTRERRRIRQVEKGKTQK